MNFQVPASFFFALLIPIFCSAADPAQDGSKPLWEYGLGIGYIHLEQYPGSDQYLNVTVPFPTFQYRGEILRADDQEGARAYLVKDKIYSLEFTGGGTPPVRSDKNDARFGMRDIPWIVFVGPQIAFKLGTGFELKFTAMQATSTNFLMTRFAGQVYETKLDYRWINDSGHGGRARLSLQWGSKDFLAHFYEVAPTETWINRPVYDARPGYSSTEFTYFQTYESERTTLFGGFTYNDYSNSINRESPLYRAKNSFNYVAGIAYVIGESERRSVPADQGDGILEKVKHRIDRRLEL